MPLGDALNLNDLEQRALPRLPPAVRDYDAGGADDEITLRENRAAWQRIPIHYRVLVDVSRRSLTTSVLGAPVSLPVLAAPMALQRLVHPEGELATTRGAGRAGSVMVLSTLSTTPVEDVCAAATGPVWFQLYVYRERAVTAALVARAEAAGCQALVVTVDAPVLGRRERDLRNRFTLPAPLTATNLLPSGLERLPGAPTDSSLASTFASLVDPALSWKDLTWLAGVTRLPLVLKGIVRPDDAVRAAHAGVRAIVVSNHGGRQLDTAPATADVLARVVDAVDGRAEVYVDGGLRRGTDVLKALAMGARAVLLGRPLLWGLALGGADGVAAVFDMLRDELDRALALAGCPRVSDVGRDLLTG